MNHLWANALVAFFILGWAYYMVATILMKGTIFTRLRMYIGRRAALGSKFFGFFRDMLGCLMCTATEAALWTLGISSFAVAFHYRLVSHAVGALGGRDIAMNWMVELLLTAASAFALSVAVSGQAWAIKTIVEHREEKFLALREEFRSREEELLRRIAELEMHPSGTSETVYEFDLT